ncbi:N(4)-(beta-N-acetylglucosaminyl)-L-asparaginase [Porifericola rhodea]|uniref:isoaspartyl peptidase/L-asparaginase family protein n=1 Tax=Porifericola rhodea TaxID=930972 RepID=UPI002666106A|nr:N(4)-(beta-N-acetylglucosaminyl)-L-asparaginase [Porifericola rhodea]WKN30512.1 N(4)-(beta-N-acetylglucosaminyl)-L-asparaginase [Porifericola rhodea]
MTKRRSFLKKITAASVGLGNLAALRPAFANPAPQAKKPVVVSTWRHGLAANEAAWKVLSKGGRALDAVEAGVMVTEAEDNLSVGYGGLPDRDGRVTLDACIMDENGECGAVACLEEIMHPISVARLVMEKTPHVMLVGEGAQEFALSQGFKKENLLTERSKKAWKEWLKEAEYKPIINIENHDTIGMLALDEEGNLSGACTTSGLAYKMHGRVGDSPIIGAGLFIDNEVGAATATGMGEAIVKICGAHLIVELMRQGYSPQEACEVAIKRISKQKNAKDIQIGFLALGKNGEVGSYALQKGFDYATYADGKNQMTDVGSFYR